MSSAKLLFIATCLTCEQEIDVELFVNPDNPKQCVQCSKKRLTRSKFLCETCGAQGNFNYSGSMNGIRCKMHKLKDMVSLRDKKECSIRFHKYVNYQKGRVIGKFVSSTTKVECVCPEGHVCYPTLNTLKEGFGMCTDCRPNSLLSGEKKFRQRIKNLGGNQIGQYKGSHIKVKCVCKEGHICYPISDSMSQGRGMCLICANQDPETSKNNFYYSIEKEFKGKVEGQYINSCTQVKCICSKGHECSPRPNDIQQGQGMCLICSGSDPAIAAENFYKRIKEMGGIPGKYINNVTSVECICMNNHKCYPRPADVQQGCGMCNQCSCSGGETKLYQAFATLNIQSIFQVRHSRIPKLRYDYSCVYKDEVVYFEFDGSQHFDIKDKFCKTEEEFDKRRQLDLLKIFVCTQEDIKLIRIDYTWMKKDLDEWIEFIESSLESEERIIYSTPHLYSWVNDPSDDIMEEYLEY